MAKIQEFIAQVKTGGMARTNRYSVMFSVPGISNPDALRKVLLFCDQVQIPGVNFSTVQNRTFGEFREVPYEKLYDQCSLTFYVDKDMQVKRLFDDWINSIQNPNDRTFNYYDSYKTDVTIQVEDLNDKSVYQLKMFECYPKNIGTVQLDYASKDVMKLTIQMQYKYWVSQNTTTGSETVSSTAQSPLNKAIEMVKGGVITYGITKLPSILKKF